MAEEYVAVVVVEKYSGFGSLGSIHLPDRMEPFEHVVVVERQTRKVQPMMGLRGQERDLLEMLQTRGLEMQRSECEIESPNTCQHTSKVFVMRFVPVKAMAVRLDGPAVESDLLMSAWPNSGLHLTVHRGHPTL